MNMDETDRLLEELAKRDPNNSGVVAWRKAKRAHDRFMFIAGLAKWGFWAFLVGIVCYYAYLVLWVANQSRSPRRKGESKQPIILTVDLTENMEYNKGMERKKKE